LCRNATAVPDEEGHYCQSAVGPPRLSAQTVNYLVQGAIKRAGIDPLPYSAHSLRPGFVTYAHFRGTSDRAIAHQTRHRSMATLEQYVRIHWVRARYRDRWANHKAGWCRRWLSSPGR
jgi:integrase